MIEVALPNTYGKTRESQGVVYELMSANRRRPAPRRAAFCTLLEKEAL
jgi:hypothetical protein